MTRSTLPFTAATILEDRYRSPAPDLLFEDVRAARLQDIEPYLETPEAADEATALHRVTVFLTYRCNLDCPYCKTIARSEAELALWPQKAVSFTLESFERFLFSFGDTPIVHLHFTGGEAATVKELPDMVRLARTRGVEHISITSNGTLPGPVYRALVENGIDEIRISIDARDPETGESLTRRKGAWPKAVENIKTLAGLRRTQPTFFLIANAVVTDLNRKDTAEIVRFLMGLGVNDIKLIMAVQEKETLGDFPEAASILREIEATLLNAYPAEAFPLLRRKIRTVFDREAIGLAEMEAPNRQDWRCYIPLTERTVDGMYYYPCSVYLREGGAPLGRLEEPMALQREKTAAFVRRGNCLSDPICQQYCLHCTKLYNAVANEARQ